MKWSWKLGKFAGIDVYLHATFILLLAWIASMHWMARHSTEVMLSGLAFMLALFGSVLLHEFGHALTAKAFGIGTRDITLLPIGGISRIEKMPTGITTSLLGMGFATRGLTNTELRELFGVVPREPVEIVIQKTVHVEAPLEKAVSMWPISAIYHGFCRAFRKSKTSAKAGRCGR